MKKQNISPLTLITCIFAAFLAGFLLGRNLFRGDVLVSVPAQTPKPTIAAESTISATEEQTGPININTADIYTLASLPGIGESLARRIVEYRNTNGAFSSPEELLNVSGIGTGKLEPILDLITTGG